MLFTDKVDRLMYTQHTSVVCFMCSFGIVMVVVDYKADMIGSNSIMILIF